MGGAGAAMGVACVVFLVALPIGLLIGAVILRAAVALANKCLPQPQSRYYEDDYDDDYEDDYEDRPRRRRGGGAKAIPDPTFGRAMLIVLVNGIIGAGFGFVVGLVANGAGLNNPNNPNPGAALAIQGVNLVVGFFIAAGVLTGMLPTTFPRACLVVVFQYLIVFAIAIVIVVPLVILGVGMAGLR